MRIINLKQEDCLTDEQAEALAGKQLDESYFTTILSEDCIVYKPNGEILLVMKKNIIPKKIAHDAYLSLRKAATPTENRGVSAGMLTQEELGNDNVEKVSAFRVANKIKRADGTVSKTNRARVVNSGIIGYFDRYQRIPYCRQTAFNQNQFEKFKKAVPFIRLIDRAYEELVPDRYKIQKEWADKTSQDFVIKGTSFTTVTVNKNFQTAVHTDKGDLKEGFGNLAVLEGGKYEGGYTGFPKFKVAVDCRSCDVVLMDVHEWHGNTGIIKRSRGAERISVVCYYRRNMIKCGNALEELEVAKNPVKGRGVSYNMNPKNDLHLGESIIEDEKMYERA